MGVNSDRLQARTVSVSTRKPKPLGGYLVEAGLLTTDQVKVALNDQQATGLRFGDVLVARGWVKEQTIEWVMEKVVIPEKQAATPPPQQNPTHPPTQPPTLSQDPTLRQPRLVRTTNPISTGDLRRSPVSEPESAQTPASLTRRDVPISKPLPSVKSGDEDVNWVG